MQNLAELREKQRKERLLEEIKKKEMMSKMGMYSGKRCKVAASGSHFENLSIQRSPLGWNSKIDENGKYGGIESSIEYHNGYSRSSSQSTGLIHPKSTLDVEELQQPPPLMKIRSFIANDGNDIMEVSLCGHRSDKDLMILPDRNGLNGYDEASSESDLSSAGRLSSSPNDVIMISGGGDLSSVNSMDRNYFENHTYRRSVDGNLITVLTENTDSEGSNSDPPDVVDESIYEVIYDNSAAFSASYTGTDEADKIYDNLIDIINSAADEDSQSEFCQSTDADGIYTDMTTLMSEPPIPISSTLAEIVSHTNSDTASPQQISMLEEKDLVLTNLWSRLRAADVIRMNGEKEVDDGKEKFFENKENSNVKKHVLRMDEEQALQQQIFKPHSQLMNYTGNSPLDEEDYDYSEEISQPAKLPFLHSTSHRNVTQLSSLVSDVLLSGTSSNASSQSNSLPSNGGRAMFSEYSSSSSSLARVLGNEEEMKPLTPISRCRLHALSLRLPPLPPSPLSSLNSSPQSSHNSSPISHQPSSPLHHRSCSPLPPLPSSPLPPLASSPLLSLPSSPLLSLPSSLPSHHLSKLSIRHMPLPPLPSDTRNTSEHMMWGKEESIEYDCIDPNHYEALGSPQNYMCPVQGTTSSCPNPCSYLDEDPISMRPPALLPIRVTDKRPPAPLPTEVTNTPIRSASPTVFSYPSPAAPQVLISPENTMPKKKKTSSNGRWRPHLKNGLSASIFSKLGVSRTSSETSLFPHEHSSPPITPSTHSIKKILDPVSRPRSTSNPLSRPKVHKHLILKGPSNSQSTSTSYKVKGTTAVEVSHQENTSNHPTSSSDKHNSTGISGLQITKVASHVALQPDVSRTSSLPSTDKSSHPSAGDNTSKQGNVVSELQVVVPIRKPINTPRSGINTNSPQQNASINDTASNVAEPIGTDISLSPGQPEKDEKAVSKLRKNFLHQIHFKVRICRIYNWSK